MTRARRAGSVGASSAAAVRSGGFGELGVSSVSPACGYHGEGALLPVLGLQRAVAPERKPLSISFGEGSLPESLIPFGEQPL